MWAPWMMWTSLLWTPIPAQILPLFLTPLIEQGRIREAQEKSYVDHMTSDPIDSYSGYLTVDSRYDSNLFFWFFPAETNASEAPLLLWLNGGPSRPSVFGALLENGPLEITYEGELKRRAVSWTEHFSMLYVDNPVNTGYSFTKHDAGMSTSMEEVSVNLYSFLVQFFKLFPEHSKNDFYVGGQSYAGKYVPSLGVYIHEKNVQSPPPEIFINFKGIAWAQDSMLPVYPDFLFHAGFISKKTRQIIRERNMDTIKQVLSGNATSKPDDYYIETLFHTKNNNFECLDSLIGHFATNQNLQSLLARFLASPFARSRLHVGYAVQQDFLIQNDTVIMALFDDFFENTNKENAFLMDTYKVLHYSGNLDVVVNVPMTETFLDHVPWSGREEYRRSVRKPWMIYFWVEGWTTVVKNFTRVIVRNAGHMVPYDRPEAALDMMRRFVFDQPF